MPTTTPTLASYLAYCLREVVEPNLAPKTTERYSLLTRRPSDRQSGVTFRVREQGKSRVHARPRDHDRGPSRRCTVTVSPDRSVRSNRGAALNRRNSFVTSDRGVIPVWLLAPFDLRYGSG